MGFDLRKYIAEYIKKSPKSSNTSSVQEIHNDKMRLYALPPLDESVIKDRVTELKNILWYSDAKHPEQNYYLQLQKMATQAKGDEKAGEQFFQEILRHYAIVESGKSWNDDIKKMFPEELFHELVMTANQLLGSFAAPKLKLVKARLENASSGELDSQGPFSRKIKSGDESQSAIPSRDRD